jgi:tetratricopeptide (TPR) repeat protein
MTQGYQEIDLVQAHAQAKRLVASGRPQEAFQLLMGNLHQTYALEEDYAPAVSLLGGIFHQRGDARGALTCAWYLNDDRVADGLLPRVPPGDRARTYVWKASRLDQGDPRTAELRVQAAREFDSAGHIAHAAVYLERAGQHQHARPLWSRLSHAIAPTQEADLYAGALARFNLARTSRRDGDPAAAHAATVASVHLLEEAADRYESLGQRERAFDCYQVLAAIGRDSGTIEHALEGFVNLTRILREDQLRSYALREYGDAIRFLREKSEIAAAATLCREMAAYARREGMKATANHALLQQAGMWRELAVTTLERGHSPEIAENALLAAVLSYAELGQYRRAGATYVELAHLPLESARRAHYARASNRYEGAQDEPMESSQAAESPRQDNAFSEVWHVDLLEWEQRGSAADVCADIMIDRDTWSEVIRRRAMLARLVALPLEAAPESAQTNDWLHLVERLAPTELYLTLSPLEALYRRSGTEVRVAVVRALGRFLYKRSFITLRLALSDPDSTVRAQAWESIQQLHFPHAFDPLARIFREASDPEARRAALRALAMVDSEEATELVLATLQHAGPSERDDVVRTLSKACGPRLVRSAMDALASAKGEWSGALRAVLQAQGVRPR